MFQIHEQQYSTFKALERIIRNEIMKFGDLSETKKRRIYFLGCEHGFCKDVVNELFEHCMEALSEKESLVLQ